MAHEKKSRHIYENLLKRVEKKARVALATITATRGSTPQVPGASALFSNESLVAGTLGGGLLEADATQKAFACLREGKADLFTYRLLGDVTTPGESICGGEATILVDPFPEKHEQTFQNLVHALKDRMPGILITILNKRPEGPLHIKRQWIEEKALSGSRFPGVAAGLEGEIRRCMQEKKPLFLRFETAPSQRPTSSSRSEEAAFYLEPHFPLPRLVIAGAGHVGQAVAHLGSLLDFEVTVVDDRPEFANPERIPEADRIIVQDIGKAVSELPKTEDTYVVIVTRGHRHDADALKACIKSDAAYIGMIGSARKIALMRKNFLENGWASPSEFDRVHAPIGLEIDSRTVQEIAVSIAAELVLVRSRTMKEGKGTR